MIILPAGLAVGAPIGTGVDPYWANVSSLLHFDGPNGSTSFTDQKGKVWTPNGNAQIDTSQSKFGGASGLFDGSLDRLSTPDHTDFRMTGDFTIEGWIRPDVNTSIRAIVSKRGSGSLENEYTVWVSAAGKLRFLVFPPYDGVAPAGDATGATTVSTGVWHHFSAVRYGTSLMVFLDGVLDGYATGPATIQQSAAPVYIGRDSSTDSSRDFDGWIDEIRLTKGVARYAGDFTPPSAPFPNA